MKSIRPQAGAAILAIALLPALSGELHAGNRVLPFQGRLTTADGSPLADGARVVQFKIYDAPVGGRAVWNGEVQNLSVNAGLVNTLLGTKASLEGVDFNLDLYLEVTVDANGDSLITLADPPLLPRQSILPAVFAKESANSQLLRGYDWSALFGTNNPAEGTLLDAKIRDGAITTAKLADNAVATAKIPDGAITRAKLDATGAQAGQSLIYNGSTVVWNQVNALNAETLKGFDWSTIFSGGNPQSGTLGVAHVSSRGDVTAAGSISANGNLSANGTTFLYGPVVAPFMAASIFMGDNSLYLRGNGDFNHYVSYANSHYAQSGFDGPLLVGVGGGVLGNTANWTLRWWNNGNVTVRGTVSSGSDRNIKENFDNVDPAEVLDKVVALPITRWNYKDDPASQHIGPVSQDFRAAFGLGSDDKTIATVDADGIALTAIQALNTKMSTSDDDLRRLLTQQQAQIDALKAEIAALQQARH